jgi:hypothetical protein
VSLAGCFHEGAQTGRKEFTCSEALDVDRVLGLDDGEAARESRFPRGQDRVQAER